MWFHFYLYIYIYITPLSKSSKIIVLWCTFRVADGNLSTSFVVEESGKVCDVGTVICAADELAVDDFASFDITKRLFCDTSLSHPWISQIDSQGVVRKKFQ